MNNFIEKRHHIRIPLTFVTVEVFLQNNTTAYNQTSSIIDISESGMKFVSDRYFEIGTPLQLTFILPGSTISIQATALVIYQQMHQSLYNTGVRFSVLELIDFTLLRTYIDALISKN